MVCLSLPLWSTKGVRNLGISVLLHSWTSKYCFTKMVRLRNQPPHSCLPPATKLRQGNVFTSMCQEFCPWKVSVPACTTGHMTGWGLCPGGLCLGVSVWGFSVWGSLSEGLCPEGSLSRGSLSRGSLSRGLSLSGGLCPGGLCTGVSVQRSLCPGGSLSKGVSVWGSLSGGSLSGGLCTGVLCPGCFCLWVSVQGGFLLGRPPRTETPPHMVTSGRYTSYWNAFLFHNSRLIKRSHHKKLQKIQRHDQGFNPDCLLSCQPL